MLDEQIILMAFKAPWCIPCKTMEPVIKEALCGFNNVRFSIIDVDKEPDLAREYCIRTIPTLVLKDGDRVEKLVGSASIEQVKDFLSKYV
jgi:thioredoxin 1